MIDWQRIVILGGIGAVIIALLIRWSDFQEARLPVIETGTTTATEVMLPDMSDTVAQLNNTTSSEDNDSEGTDAIPSPQSDATAPEQTTPVVASRAQLVHVKTDSLEVLIDTFGGDIVKVALPKYPVTIERPNDPLVLLNRNDTTLYIAQSGLVGKNGTDRSGRERPIFSVGQTEYVLSESDDSISVDLTYQQDQVTITKRFTFRRGQHLIDLEYLIDNKSSEEWVAHLYGQIRRDDKKPVNTMPGFSMSSFFGVATTTSEENYKKMDFEDIEEAPFKHSITGGWVAMVQHYFISAWIPNPDTENDFLFRKIKNTDQYTFAFTGPGQRVAPGAQSNFSAEFYVGPKDINRMEEIAPHLELTIDYGFLEIICKPLFHFLDWLHSYLGNWGLAIIILTLCVKAAFFHLSATSYRSMAKMRKFAPKMKELKERFGDNRQKLQEETMKLYKQEKVNPLGGCLPMLVQIPVFISLYWVLMESVELRHAPFMLWIDDLSAKDPYFVLPLIYGTTFWVQQKLNPQMGDPTQQKIMQMMPWVFTIFFLFFPSGLVLYWVVNGLLSMAQQYVITRQIEKADTKTS